MVNLSKFNKGIMMEGSIKKWTIETEDFFNKFISLFKKSIILDAEFYSEFRGFDDEINIQCFEFALYKSVMTFNESIKANIIKNSGMDGMKLIGVFEQKAINDITIELINEIDDLNRKDDRKIDEEEN